MSDYGLLTLELAKWFTPVQLTAIQTQLFHERRQGSKEMVDDRVCSRLEGVVHYIGPTLQLFAKQHPTQNRTNTGSQST